MAAGGAVHAPRRAAGAALRRRAARGPDRGDASRARRDRRPARGNRRCRRRWPSTTCTCHGERARTHAGGRRAAAGSWARRASRCCAGCSGTIEVVARFLALLELYREGRLRLRAGHPARRVDRTVGGHRRRVRPVPGRRRVSGFDDGPRTPMMTDPARDRTPGPCPRRARRTRRTRPPDSARLSRSGPAVPASRRRASTSATVRSRAREPDRPPLRRWSRPCCMVAEKPGGVTSWRGAAGAPGGRRAGAARAGRRVHRAGPRVQLRDVGGGWRFYTAEECAPWVERFVLDGQQARLSQAALETLAVVAYRQPVSRARISAVRGVSRRRRHPHAVARGLVEEARTDPETGAILYRTTDYFLERLGLQLPRRAARAGPAAARGRRAVEIAAPRKRET